MSTRNVELLWEENGSETREESVVPRLRADLRRSWLVLVVVAALGGLGGGLYAALQPPVFTASSSFSPRRTTQQEGGLASLANQFGLGGLTQLAGGSSLEYYLALLDSRPILASAVKARYTLGLPGRPAGTLVDVLAPDDGTGSLDGRTRYAMGELKERIRSRANPATGVIDLDVNMPTGALAEAVNRQLLAELDDFMRDQRRSVSLADAEFASERLAEASAELKAAEGRLRTFLERNRRYTNSPELVLDYSNLQRQVDMRQQLYTSLAMTQQQARLEAARTTPILSIIEAPEGSAIIDTKSVPLWTIAGAMLGIFLAGSAVLALRLLGREDLLERLPGNRRR